MATRTDPGFGIAIPVLSAEDLTAQGVGTYSSSYTEDGPGPGAPVSDDELSRWRPTLTGAQSVALTLTTVRGGYPGVDGARAVYRLASDTGARDYRGWNEPNLPKMWTAPATAWGAAKTYEDPVACALPSGRVAVAAPDATLTTVGRTWLYDPRTEAWTDTEDWSSTAGIALPLAMAYDAGTGRLILWTGAGTGGAPTTRAWSSTDEGATWTLYSRGMWPVTVASSDRVRVAVAPDAGEWLACVDEVQCASSDRGATWYEIGALTGAAGPNYYPLRLKGGGWLVTYIGDTDNIASYRRLAAASSDWSSAVEQVIAEDGSDTNPAGDMVACVDDDGVVYVLTRGTSGATTRHVLTLRRSKDGGQTWKKYLWEPTLGDDAAVIDLRALVAAGGALHLIYDASSGYGTAVDGTWALVTWGGWDQLEAGSGAVSASVGTIARMAPGRYNGGSTHNGRLWVPYAVPTAMGWTSGASAGTVQFTAALPGMEMVCAAADHIEYAYLPAVASLGYVAGAATVQAYSDSSTLATIGTANTGVYVQPVLGNAGSTLLYEPFIDIGRDGIQVRDGSTIRATVSISTVTAPVHIRWMLRPAAITVWYRVEATATWTRLANDVTVTDTGGVNTAGVRWGCAATATGHVLWRQVWTAGGGDWLSGIDTAAQAALTSSDGVRGIRWGRPVPAAPRGYPVPDATTTAEDLGYLVATGGPTHPSEAVSLPVAYQYPAEALDPDTAPSPRTTWAASSDAQQTLVYDLGDATWLGGALAIVALRVVTPSVDVTLDDGAGGWGSAETLSLVLVGTWHYTVTGRTVVPRSGTGTLARYVHEGELVGAWALLSTAGPSVYRRITTNSAGYWTSDTTMQQVRITLAATGEDGGVDGTETAAGVGTLYHHSAVRVVYPSADTARRYVRIRIAAVTGGGVPSGGIVTLCRVVAAGADPTWTWTRTLTMSRVLARAADGTPTVRRTGPPRWVWSYPWTDGVDLRTMRTLAAGAAYMGASGGVPIGTAEDVWSVWPGLIEGALRSGELPCLLLPALPAASATITDPSLYVYGILAADSIALSGVVGEEGVDEVLRLDAPTIEEVR